MAVDWITNKLYWTDTGEDTISVLDLNTNIRKTLFNLSSESVNSVEPRAIVIDPLTRLISNSLVNITFLDSFA
jgi:DNA-binding beta-propeller fold protein YncE